MFTECHARALAGIVPSDPHKNPKKRGLLCWPRIFRRKLRPSEVKRTCLRSHSQPVLEPGFEPGNVTRDPVFTKLLSSREEVFLKSKV